VGACVRACVGACVRVCVRVSVYECFVSTTGPCEALPAHIRILRCTRHMQAAVPRCHDHLLRRPAAPRLHREAHESLPVRRAGPVRPHPLPGRQAPPPSTEDDPIARKEKILSSLRKQLEQCTLPPTKLKELQDLIFEFLDRFTPDDELPQRDPSRGLLSSYSP